MSVAQSLQTRRVERDALLDRIVSYLREDKRVVAAWLTGSLGRGDGDDLSDIDIWVAVADNYSRFVIAGRREFVKRVEIPLLVKEAPQNAPSDGGYLLTLYSGSCGPHQVDWYWQPQGKSIIPDAAKVLFDMVGLPVAAPSDTSDAQRAEFISERVAFFWSMIAIAAKKVARSEAWAAVHMIEMVQNTLAEVRHGLLLDDNPKSSVPPISPVDQMRYVRALAGEIETLQPDILALAADPAAVAAAQSLTFFDLVDGMLHEQESNDKPG